MHGTPPPPLEFVRAKTRPKTPPQWGPRTAVKLRTPPEASSVRRFTPFAQPTVSTPRSSPKRKRPRTGQTPTKAPRRPKLKPVLSFHFQQSVDDDGGFGSFDDGLDDGWDLIAKRDQIESIQRELLPLYLECLRSHEGSFTRVSKRLFIVQDWDANKRRLKVPETSAIY
jgi:hypothetical protein